MSKVKIFLTLTGYQITWVVCVFGESKFSQPFAGIFLGIIFILTYLYFSNDRIKFLKIILLIALPGYLFDTGMILFSIYEFNSSTITLALPTWMIILWLSFAVLFDEILIIVSKFRIIAIFLSAFLGTSTYYIGEPLNIISINNLFLFFLFMIIFWSLLIIYYTEFVLKTYKFS